jgi:hypothetical protein
MQFFEAPAFTKNLARYLDDAQYCVLQEALAASPDSGDVIAGTGGFRNSAGRMPAEAKDEGEV